ncbi:hypothetical protein SAMN02745206_03008, partial [Desulfacinum infernum DSM 9756]
GRFPVSTHGFVGDCAVFCVSAADERGSAEAAIITDGRMLSLSAMGCTASWQPIAQCSSPQRGKTTNRRAVCGRSARTVRRGEGLGNESFLPLSGGFFPKERFILRCHGPCVMGADRKEQCFRLLVGAALASIGIPGKPATTEDASWFTLSSRRGGEPRHDRWVTGRTALAQSALKHRGT